MGCSGARPSACCPELTPEQEQAQAGGKRSRGRKSARAGGVCFCSRKSEVAPQINTPLNRKLEVVRLTKQDLQRPGQSLRGTARTDTKAQRKKDGILRGEG